MASTYVNDLRLNEMATGDQSGSWGTVTNTNLELIAEAFSYGTEAITTNADTHTTTIADGATDPGRSMFLKYTGTLDSACTITIGPNTVSKLWFIENATSGSQNIIIKQGSGATVTIASGKTKAIYSDGVGSGAKMVDAFAALDVGALSGTSATFDGGVDIDNINIDGTTIALSSGAMTISGADDITLDAVGDVILSCDGDQVKFDDGTTTRFTFNLDSTPTMGMGTLTLFENEIDVSSGNLTLDVAGDIVLDAAGADIGLNVGGTEYGKFNLGGNSLNIHSSISNGDILFKGNDGGSTITALTLDMSSAGAATFNNEVTATTYNGDGSNLTGITDTTYSAGAGLNLSGTTFSVESDQRGDIFTIGQDTADYIHVDTAKIDFFLDGNNDMRLENDGDLHVDGNVIAYSSTISDERLKKDIVKIDNALDKVSQLNGYTFEYLADGKKSAGVIAQEVEKVMPSAITESTLPLKMGEDDKTEYKTVQYDQLHGLMIEAIKELKAEIEELKAR